MNKRMKLSAVLVALAMMACAHGCTRQKQKEAKMSDAIGVIMNRKSVRNFTGEGVGREALDQLLRAGMAAPTAVNRQPWSFVVVTDRQTLNALNDGLPHAQMLDKAGAAIVVCAHPARAFQESLEYAIIDTSNASENILLAAEALGLGALWTVVYPDKARMEFVRKALQIPDEAIPLNVIPIGHPTGADMPKDKYKAENIHWEKW
ncbi:MAG: nitroreductase family protein [Pseudomonadota bacterium]